MKRGFALQDNHHCQSSPISNEITRNTTSCPDAHSCMVGDALLSLSPGWLISLEAEAILKYYAVTMKAVWFPLIRKLVVLFCNYQGMSSAFCCRKQVEYYSSQTRIEQPLRRRPFLDILKISQRVQYPFVPARQSWQCQIMITWVNKLFVVEIRY